jgi:hypothetical protein
MSKIVMANIKMPISVNNGKLQPMSEYIKITVEKCDELPEKNQDTDGSLMTQIDKILSCQSSREQITHHENEQKLEPISKLLNVSLDEIQNNRPIKSRQNMSFKNKSSRSISKYTMKNRSSSSNTSDVVHSLQQEVEE